MLKISYLGGLWRFLVNTGNLKNRAPKAKVGRSNRLGRASLNPSVDSRFTKGLASLTGRKSQLVTLWSQLEVPHGDNSKASDKMAGPD